MLFAMLARISDAVADVVMVHVVVDWEVPKWLHHRICDGGEMVKTSGAYRWANAVLDMAAAASAVVTFVDWEVPEWPHHHISGSGDLTRTSGS